MRDFTKRKLGVLKLLWRLISQLPKINIKEFKGRTVDIDARLLLYRAILKQKRLKDVLQGRINLSDLKYCEKIFQLLQQYGVKMVVVFHGSKLKLQEEYDDNQFKIRRYYKLLAKKGMLQVFYRKAIDVSELDLVHQLKQKLREMNVEFYVAPYDANAQLTFLAIHKHVDAVISEDPHLIPFACPRVIYKVDESGDGFDYQHAQLSEYNYAGMVFSGLDEETRLNLFVLSTCKYFWVESDMHGAFFLFEAFDGFEKLFAGDETEQGRIKRTPFYQAVNAFKYHIVYDPDKKRMVYLSELPERLIGNCGFLGSIKGADVAEQIANGIIHPATLKPLPTYNEENAHCKRKRLADSDDEEYDLSTFCADSLNGASDVSSEPDDMFSYKEDYGSD